MTKLKWLAVGIVAAVFLVVGGTWVYINVVRDDAPPPLALAESGADAPSSTAPAADADDGSASTADGGDDESVAGTWVPAEGSVVGYRVAEILFGQSVEAVGRSDQIDGEVAIEADVVTAASFEVDVASIESDDDRRDRQFRGRIMDVATHPTATLVLTEPVELGSAPPAGETIAATATAELTLRGTTRSVQIDLEAQRADGRIEVLGSIPITFADWGIPSPSVPGIDTEDDGLLEFLVVLERG